MRAPIILVLCLATISRSLRVRLPFGGRKGRSISNNAPPLVQISAVDNIGPLGTLDAPDAALDAAAEKRRRADDARRAAEAASSEAMRLTAEALALKVQLAEMRAPASAGVAPESSRGGSETSMCASLSSADTRASSPTSGSTSVSTGSTTTSSTSASASSSVSSATVTAEPAASAPPEASVEAEAEAGPQAMALDTAVRRLEELLETGEAVELSSEQATELMMEEASSRVVWSELGLGPQEAFPIAPLATETIDGLRERVFGLDSFAVRQVETTPCGVLFRGSLRQSDPAKVSALVQRRLQSDAVLAPQLRLFLLADPLPADRAAGWDDEALAFDPLTDELPFEAPPEPVFLALPTSLRPAGGGANESVAALALPLASQFLGLAVCVGWAAYAFLGTPALLSNGEIELERVLPIVRATLALQLLHEGAHVAAAMRHRLQVSVPFVIPSSSLGLGGGHAPLASFPQNRTQLYDFALAGPLAGGLASAAVFAVGLSMTASANPEAAALFPQLPTATLHSSVLASLVVELTLGVPFGAEAAGSYALHPLALAGLSGLFSNALAMLPIGRLDGGRAATAAYGRRAGAALGALALLLLALACALSEAPEVLLLWSGLSVGLFRQAEVLCVDEISELDTRRSQALLPLLVVAALFLCPLPGGDDAGAAFGELARVAAGDSELW